MTSWITICAGCKRADWGERSMDKTDGEAFAELIEKDSGVAGANGGRRATDVMYVIAFDSCAGNRTERIDAGAIGENLHNLGNIVANDMVPGGVIWARIPCPADGDACVAKMRYSVVEDPVVGRFGDADGTRGRMQSPSASDC